MANKKTRKEFFMEIAEIAENLGNVEIVEFCNHEITLIENKKAKAGQTANQVANEGIKELIIKALRTIGEPVTITEMQSKTPELADYSNQKLSALISQMKVKNGGNIDFIKDKKATKFFLID